MSRYDIHSQCLEDQWAYKPNEAKNATGSSYELSHIC